MMSRKDGNLHIVRGIRPQPIRLNPEKMSRTGVQNTHQTARWSLVLACSLSRRNRLLGVSHIFFTERNSAGTGQQMESDG